MVTCKIIFFAKSRELVGRLEDMANLPSHTSPKCLLAHVVELYPQLQVIANSIMLALNQEYISFEDETVQLQENDEIAVIPPISGG